MKIMLILSIIVIVICILLTICLEVEKTHTKIYLILFVGYIVFWLFFLIYAIEADETKNSKNNYIQDNEKIEIYIDEKTGVNYIMDINDGIMTVRLNPDGSPYVTDIKKEK